MKKTLLIIFSCLLLCFGLASQVSARAIGVACSPKEKGVCQDAKAAPYNDPKQYTCVALGQCDTVSGKDTKCCAPVTSSTSPSPASGPSPDDPAKGQAGDSSGSGSGTGSSSGGGGSVDLSTLSPVKIDASAEGIAGLIGTIINAALGVVGALALFMFIYGGIYLISSAGAPDKVKKGKDVIVWSVIGIAVILGSYALTSFVISGILGTGGGGGASGGDTGNNCGSKGCCGVDGGTKDHFPAYSCMATTTGKFCKDSLCPGTTSTKCCQPASSCGSGGCCGDTSVTKSKTPAYSCILVKGTDLTQYNCQPSLCPGKAGATDEKKCCQTKSGSTSPTQRCPVVSGSGCSFKVPDDNCCPEQYPGYTCITNPDSSYDTKKCACSGASTELCAKKK